MPGDTSIQQDKELQPGDPVICQINSYTTRRGVFVRYVKPRDDWNANFPKCLVQFRPNGLPTRIDVNQVGREELSS